MTALYVRPVSAANFRSRPRESQAERKRETRRKILAGAMTLDRVERGELPESRFKADMDRFLERPQERALFDLPPRSED